MPKLNEGINRATQQPDIAAMMAAELIIIAEPPEYFRETIRSDYAKYGKLARATAVQPQ